MQIAPEIVQELHVICVRELRRYIVDANETCKILAENERCPVSLEPRNAILQQRRVENAAHESYQRARHSLFDAARWNETAKQDVSLAAINRLDSVSSNGGVGGEQCHALKTRLRNQHAIKRIAVMERQFACSQGVLVGDSHRVKLPPCERISNKFGRRKRQFQRAAGELDRDFPCTDR